MVVADAISARRIDNIEGVWGANVPNSIAMFSPDKKYFLLHETRGDIQRNVNVETLLLYRTRDVEAYLAGASQPVPKTLAEIPVHVDWGAMRSISWRDTSHVSFVSEGRGLLSQGFVVDVPSGRIHQVTNSSNNVTSFASSKNYSIYYDAVPPTDQDVVALGNRPLSEIIWNKLDTTYYPLELVQVDRATGAKRVLIGPKAPMPRYWQRVWASPDGRYAIALTPSIDPPTGWAAYRLPANVRFSPDNSRNTTPWLPGARPRYQLIDLKSNKLKPLLDAPSGAATYNGTPQQVFWEGGGHTAIVTNTFLPLSGVDAESASVRSNKPATAEINLDTGELTPIFFEPGFEDGSHPDAKAPDHILSITWNGRSLFVVTKKGDGRIATTIFHKSEGTWNETIGGSEQSDLAIDRVESLNSRPIVYAKGVKCECTRELLDPSPELNEVSFGHTELFDWTDSNHTEWHAGLVYPPNYIPGKRYPLVIQTHGFSPTEFLMMAPGDYLGAGTAMAAQPLANSGIIVLQVGEPPSLITADEKEGPAVAEGIRTAIQILVSRGIVDPDRIGMIAFSRTGLHLVSLMSKYPDLLAAANISDSVQPGYWQRALTLNEDPVARASAVALDGPGPEQIGYDAYFRTDPLYGLRKGNTALRIEAIDQSSAVAMWGTYAVRREAHRPVDFVYFPHGGHNLAKPAERLGSQQGNVDWFRFWLQDYEDPSPEKKGQYRLWESLRAERAQQNPSTANSR